MKFIGLIVSFAALFHTCLGFTISTMSAVSIGEPEGFNLMEKEEKKVILFTSEGCRSCIRYRKEFEDMSQRFSDVKMFRVTLGDPEQSREFRKSIMDFSKNRGIHRIPFVLVEDGPNSSGFTGIPKNYRLIEESVSVLKV